MIFIYCLYFILFTKHLFLYGNYFCFVLVNSTDVNVSSIKMNIKPDEVK